ncbi:hypothetical protein EB230_31785 [Mesorhizobium sp. NZP2234]|uniref:hypothetical protein n=1 Tax=Mesorhizobium sp. NZP2234 TaxID=2483402 RepID=UPI001551BF7C|nr:hypothetical protein [Mesorhizobium sp. NZP2234]QKC92430.1 hypothetical protein EB230_31785 [Mesorhizobium sp. NZP2234]
MIAFLGDGKLVIRVEPLAKFWRLPAAAERQAALRKIVDYVAARPDRYRGPPQSAQVEGLIAHFV